MNERECDAEINAACRALLPFKGRMVPRPEQGFGYALNDGSDLPPWFNPCSGFCGVVEEHFLLGKYEADLDDLRSTLRRLRRLCAIWPDGTGSEWYPVPGDASFEQDVREEVGNLDSLEEREIAKAAANWHFESASGSEMWIEGDYAQRRWAFVEWLETQTRA